MGIEKRAAQEEQPPKGFQFRFPLSTDPANSSHHTNYISQGDREGREAGMGKRNIFNPTLMSAFGVIQFPHFPYFVLSVAEG